MASSPRRRSVAVRVGSVMVGGGNPIVVQSMTNTDTADTPSTVNQVMALANAGSELVRVTVNTDDAAPLGIGSTSVTMLVPDVRFDGEVQSGQSAVDRSMMTGESVPAGEGLDHAQISRRVRSAAAWAGNFRSGAYRAGDGTSSVTVDLAGEHASFTLAITIDPATGLLYQLDLAGG